MSAGEYIGVQGGHVSAKDTWVYRGDLGGEGYT